MIRTIVGLISAAIFITGTVVYKQHEMLSVPHPPHSEVQYSIEQFLAKTAQHGPEVECEQRCAPKGFEDETDKHTDLPVVTCAGNNNGDVSCARQGSHCGDEHRYGCAESCRPQCCDCCSI